MEEDKKNYREVFLPGDEVGGENQKSGYGTYREDGKIYSSHVGVRTGRNEFVNIIPLGGKYNPRPGDQVIAYIEEIGPTYWMTNINSPYPAPLHVNDTPWKVNFGDTAKYLEINDVIIAVISSVDEIKHVQISMKEHGHRRVNSGSIVEITPSKVPRVIGKGGSMISLIKNTANCRLFVGQNGRIWIDGEEEAIELAIRAIEMIERESHSFGLTEKVNTFLEEEAAKIFPQTEKTGEEEKEDVEESAEAEDAAEEEE